MQRPANATMTVETELRGQLATVQLVRFQMRGPVAGDVGAQDSHRLEMCLTPRPQNARGCYRERWRSDRFEPLGEVFLVPAGHLLRAMSDSGRQRALICQMPSDLVSKWFADDLVWSEPRLEASLDITNRTISSLLYRLAEEARNPGFASEALVEAATIQLAIELTRYSTSTPEPSAAGGLAPWRMRLIDERLAAQLPAPTLTELAQLCNVSVRHLTRGFRISKGCSLGDHITHARLERAKHMLTTDNTIHDIAAVVGFSSASSFSYAFRKAIGQTPRQFRETLAGTVPQSVPIRNERRVPR